MKKLLFTVILTAACQITFASIAFGHERGEYRHHEGGYYRPHSYCRPVMIARPSLYSGYYAYSGPRIWISGRWIFGRRGREIWIPGHWNY